MLEALDGPPHDKVIFDKRTHSSRRITMNIESVPFQFIDWTQAPQTTHPGEPGVATWRTVEAGNVRARIVEYSPGYRADHWCSRGHVIHVLEGELVTEVQGGPTHVLTAGMSYIVSSGLAPHRSSTGTGARLFIVD